MKSNCPQSPAALLHTLQAVFPATLPVAEQLQAAILPEPAVWLRDGGVINHGYHAELDELRHIQNHGDEFLLALEARERERTGLVHPQSGVQPRTRLLHRAYPKCRPSKPPPTTSAAKPSKTPSASSRPS
jgi:DNA mismatch repair ATPase MutS